jgi:predicted nuclease of predicted toxin-antitoxin system
LKFLLDNNLSPFLAHALNELAKADGHNVVALRDKFETSTPDIEWIDTLTKEKNWVIISQDHFNKIDGLEKEAIKRSGLTVFCLKKA